MTARASSSMIGEMCRSPLLPLLLSVTLCGCKEPAPQAPTIVERGPLHLNAPAQWTLSEHQTEREGGRSVELYFELGDESTLSLLLISPDPGPEALPVVTQAFLQGLKSHEALSPITTQEGAVVKREIAGQTVPVVQTPILLRDGKGAQGATLEAASLTNADTRLFVLAFLVDKSADTLRAQVAQTLAQARFIAATPKANAAAASSDAGPAALRGSPHAASSPSALP